MSKTIAITSNVMNAFDIAKGHTEHKHSVILVHEDSSQQIAEVHFGAYTVEGPVGEREGVVAVKTVNPDSGEKKIVAKHRAKDVKAVYYVDSNNYGKTA